MNSVSPFSGIKSVLVVLSSKAQSFDLSALRNFITHAYPNAAVFFISTSGDALGVEGPHKVDLVIDFTPPGARQGLFFGRKLRSRGKNVVGRKGGFFRKNFDRLYDEASDQERPSDYLDSERWAQKKVLELAGIPIIRHGGLTEDRSKEIALELPPMNRG